MPRRHRATAAAAFAHLGSVEIRHRHNDRASRRNLVAVQLPEAIGKRGT